MIQENTSLEELGYISPIPILDGCDLDIINNELDAIFKKPSINFSFGFIRLDKTRKSVPMPLVFIRQYNLLALIEKIFGLLKKNSVDFNQNDYRLSEIEIYSENSDLDDYPWHTDQTEDGVIAILYLKGGGEQSGGSEYIPTSHKLHHQDGDHLIDNRTILDYKKTYGYTDLSGKPGDIVFYKLNGFHTRKVIKKERRILRLKFYKRDSKTKRGKSVTFDDIPISLSSISGEKKIPKFLLNNHSLKPFNEINIGGSYYFSNPSFLGIQNLLTYVYFSAMKTVKEFFSVLNNKFFKSK